MARTGTPPREKARVYRTGRPDRLRPLLFAVAAVLCIYISLKTDDGMLRGFGLTFLAINLYTRYFEYFWDGMNKVVFFLILAASLAVIGRYAERIWHAGNAEK